MTPVQSQQWKLPAARAALALAALALAAPAFAALTLGEPSGEARLGEPLVLTLPLHGLVPGATVAARVVAIESPSAWVVDPRALAAQYTVRQVEGPRGEPQLQVTSLAPFGDLFLEIEIEAGLPGEPGVLRRYTLLTQPRTAQRLAAPRTPASAAQAPTAAPRSFTPVPRRSSPLVAPALTAGTSTPQLARAAPPPEAVVAPAAAAPEAGRLPAPVRKVGPEPERIVKVAAAPAPSRRVPGLAELAAPAQAMLEPSRIAMKGFWSPQLLLLLSIPLAATAAVLVAGFMLLQPGRARARRAPG
jgi:hypothetical protein